jgi:cGMP-dependent protein kinase
VSVIKGDKVIRKMGGGDSFGEQALYYNTVRSCSVRAESEVKCLALGREVLTKILGDQIQVITFKNNLKWAFERDRNLNKLTKIQIEKILEQMEIQKYKKGEICFKKDDVCDRFLVVLEGSLVLKETGGELVKKGSTFGKEYLSEKNSNKKY